VSKESECKRAVASWKICDYFFLWRVGQGRVVLCVGSWKCQYLVKELSGEKLFAFCARMW